MASIERVRNWLWRWRYRDANRRQFEAAVWLWEHRQHPKRFGQRCTDGSLVHDFKGQPACPSCGFTGLEV